MFISAGEAASILKISIDTIRRWDKKGLIKTQRSNNNYRFFNVDEIKLLNDKINGKITGSRYKILKNAVNSGFTSVELFAGAGGTALGLENAGIHHILLNEFDRNACLTLRKNRPKWNLVEGDVRQASFKKGQADIVQGGFPCQAFSYAGRKMGFDDTRGTLFFEFARCINEIKPKIAIGENVKGLLKHDGGKTIETMLNALEEIGYRVSYRVLRSQYLDVPQKRERLIIIAIRKGLDIPFLFPKEKNYTVSLKEALAKCPHSGGQKYSPKKKAILARIPAGGYWRDLPEKLQKEYMGASFYMGGGKTGMARRLSWDEPSLTLTCNPAQKQTERCHPKDTRPLTVREYARIQTFPDNWEFTGSISSQYKQIGNAVPVNLGYHIGNCLIAMLKNKGGESMEMVTERPKVSQNSLFEVYA